MRPIPRNDRRITIVGATGFLGRHLVRRLQDRDYEPIPLSRSMGCDLLNGEAIREALIEKRSSLVINCAANTGGIAYNTAHPVEIFEENFLIALNLVSAMRNAEVCQLINILPNCTYPGNLDEYAEERWWDGELHPSVLHYGLSRKLSWGLCDAHRLNSNFRSIHMILPNMYGPGDHIDDPVRCHALSAIMGRIINAQDQGLDSVEIWGTGSAKREWLYVEDAVEGILRTIERIDHFGPSEICNLGCGKAISIRELSEKIRDLTGWKGSFLYDTSKPNGAPIKVMNTNRMRERLGGWLPGTSLEEGLSRTIVWLKQKKAGRPN